MNENKLISVAILETDLREKRVSDPIEYFEKWILYVLHMGNYDVVSTTQIQKDLKNLGMEIPQPVIKRLLRKLKKKGYLISNQNGTLKVQKSKLKPQNFKPLEKARSDFKRMLNKLVEYFVEFVKNNFQDPSFDRKTAEGLISTYLDSKSVLILKYIMGDKRLPSPAPTRKHAYYIASFLKHMLEKEPELTRYLEQLIKGHLLYGYLYYNAPSSQKFTKLDIFLDTPIVLGLLGYKGEEIQRYNEELIMLLKKEGASLKVFVETINEVERILWACKSALAYPDSAATNLSLGFDVLKEFIKRRFTPIQIQRELESLNFKLKHIGLEIEKTPPHHSTIEPDESHLEKLLDGAIHYQNKEALMHDVSCIAAIFRLRRGIRSATLENSRAIFLTTNTKVVQASNKWWKNIEKRGGIPPVVLSETIAAIAWVKQPLKAPNLPKLAVIADCYEMLNPPDPLWDKYIRAIDELKSRGELEEDEVYLLRYSAEAHHALMEKTYGDPDLLTEGTIAEILEKAKSKVIEEEKIKMKKKIERLRWEKEKTKKEKEKEKQEKLYYKEELKKERLKRFKDYYKLGKFGFIFSLIVLSVFFQVIRYKLIESKLIKDSLLGMTVIFLLSAIWEFIPVQKWKIIDNLAKWVASKITGVNPDAPVK